MSLKIRWIVWVLFLSLWTIGLLIPLSSSSWHFEDIHLSRRFLVNKSIHFAGYAALVILTGWLRAPPRLRWSLLALVVLHGGLTELIQWASSAAFGRGGSARDVFINLAGIAFGLIVSCRFWIASKGRMSARNTGSADDNSAGDNH